LTHIKAGGNGTRDKGIMQRYAIPFAIVLGVIAGTLVLLYMALCGTNP
jgi:hypothetical protein